MDELRVSKLFCIFSHPIVPRSYCLVESSLSWPTSAQTLEVARTLSCHDQPGWNSTDTYAELDWRLSGRHELAGTFRLLSIDRPEAKLLRFSMAADLRGPISMDLTLRPSIIRHGNGRLWQRSIINGRCVTLTMVDEVCVVSQDRPRDMAVQVKFLIPGWPGDAHLLSNLLQRLCGH